MQLTNLASVIAELMQEIPGCISIFLLETNTGEVLARAIPEENVKTQAPENQFFKVKNIVQEAVQANGEENFREIVISGEKQINLVTILQQKYLLWLSTSVTTKLGNTRYKLSKYLPSIEQCFL